MVRVLADITGAGATVPLKSDRSINPRGWVQVHVSGGDARMGDSDTAIGRGIPVVDGGSSFLPAPASEFVDTYNLGDLYVYLPVGAKAIVSYQE